jgi:TolB protein
MKGVDMRPSRLWWLPLSLMLGSCQSFGDLLIFGPGLVRPAALPTAAAMPGAASLAPAPTAPRWRVQAEMVLDGDVAWQGTPLSDLAISVIDVGTGRVLANGPADASGRFRVTLTEPVATGTILLVSATTAGTDLITLVQAQPRTGGTLAGEPLPVGHAVITLASTLVTKEVLPKLAEAVVTGSGTPGSDSRLAALMDRTGQLQADANLVLAGIPNDARLRQAIETANARPDATSIDALAVAAVQYSHLRGGFADVVDAANAAVVANLGAGGAIVLPATWQVGYFVIEPPVVQRATYDTLRVVTDGRTTVIPVRPDAFDRGDERVPILDALRRGLHNAPPPPPVSGGGPAPVALPPVIQSLIAFTSSHLHGNNDVFAIRLDGSGLTPLTNDALADQFPVISPDGTRIAFIADVAGDTLVVMNTDGTGRRVLGAGHFYAPSWSPDSSRIAYVSNRAGNDDIYVYDLSANTDTQVTLNVFPDAQPAWAPDGQHIAFTSFRSGGSDIYCVKPDGTAETRLTTNPIADANPAWSPDSQWIAFDAKRDGNLYKVKPDGTGEIRLTNSPGRDLKPVWSPDGQWIAFTNDRSLNDDVYVIKPDGTSETAVTVAAGANRNPCWTADSATLVFVSSRGGQTDLYRSAPDGSTQTAILVRPATEGNPSVF